MVKEAEVDKMDEYDADLSLQMKNWAAECQPPAGMRMRLLRNASTGHHLLANLLDLPIPRPLSLQISRSFTREMNSAQQIQTAVWYFQLTSLRIVY